MVSGGNIGGFPALPIFGVMLCQEINKPNPDLGQIRQLLAQGANPNAKDNEGVPALHLAAAQGHRTVVEYLLAAGADITQTDNKGKTCLHAAVTLAMPGALPILLAHPAATSVLDTPDSGGYTPLMRLASIATTRFGGSEQRMLLRTCQYLLDAGADATLQNAVGENAILQNDMGMTALMMAARYSTPEVVAMLIAKSGDIDCKNVDGETALAVAAKFYRPATARVLLEAGADVGSRTSGAEKFSVFHMLSYQASSVLSTSIKNRLELILLLGAWGADVNDVALGENVLGRLLCWELDAAAVTALLDLGAKIPDQGNALKDNEIQQRQQQAQARFEVFAQGTPPDVTLLSATDLIWFANIGRLNDVMKASLWEDHVDHLQGVLTGLPPALAHDVLTQNPSIADMLHAQATSCVLQPRCHEGTVGQGISPIRR